MHASDECEYEYDVPAADIQLGFLEPGPNEDLGKSNWKLWDGGKVGGKPIWLDPVHIPSPDELQCKNCDSPMTFLLQIYCPLDEPTSAFHRALYVFVCKKASCVQNGSYKCFRIQLKKENPYYAADPRCRGPLTCSKCRAAHYCSRSHQKLDWSLHKQTCGSEIMNSSDNTAALFPEHTIVIEDEVLDDETSLPVPATTEDDTEEQPDADFDSQLTVPTNDPVYLHFLTRIARGGNDQVLRYVCHRNGCMPLQISTSATIAPSACLQCGAPSVLEFQIMPQMLHYLQVDANTSISVTKEGEESQPVSVFRNMTTQDIDWGTLDIYTCQNSCEAACGKYVEEYMWKQDPPSVSTPSVAAQQCSVMCSPQVANSNQS